MNNLYLPLSANFEVAPSTSIAIRKLLISDFNDSENVANPAEFRFKIQIYDLFSDYHFCAFPEDEIRLPVPIYNNEGSNLFLFTHDGQESRVEEFNIGLDCQRNAPDSGINSIPYFMVFRFPSMAIAQTEQFIRVNKMQRLPSKFVFSPLFSYGKMYYSTAEEGFLWLPSPYQNGDTFQLEDVKGHLIGQGRCRADQYFPNVTEPPHKFLTPEKYVEQLRLEGEIQNPNFETYDSTVFLYFVIVGILAKREEYERFSDDYQIIPVR